MKFINVLLILFSFNLLAEDPQFEIIEPDADQKLEKIEAEGLELNLLEETNKAKAFEQEQKIQESIEIYKKLHQTYPENPDYLYNLGRLYYRLNNYQEAEKYLLKCIEIDPEQYDARLYLAYVYFNQKKYDKASKQLYVVIDNVPSYSDAYLLMGRIHQAKQQDQLAEQYLKKALSTRAPNEESWFYLGALYSKKSGYKKTLQAYEKAYDYNKDNINARTGIVAVKEFVNPSIDTLNSYAQEREKDLVTFIRTTQLNFITSSTILRYPINDNFRPIFGFYYVPEKQKNLIIHINNYNVNIYKYLAGIDMFYYNNWTTHFDFLFKHGKNNGFAGFPFRKRTSFEPSVWTKFTSIKHLAFFNYYVDSFIARNFIDVFSYFMRKQQIYALYEHRFKLPYTNLGLDGEYELYRKTKGNRTSNERRTATFWGNIGIPLDIAGYFIVKYRYQYREMENIVFDYASFKNEVTHFIQLKYIKTWIPQSFFEVAYTYQMRRYKNLTNEARIITAALQEPQVLPIHKYRGHSIEPAVNVVFGTSLHAKLSGLYYINTDDYGAWFIKGQLKWVF